MANNIVAYIGYNSYDIILYLSRILQKLGRKVLVVDYSENASLTYSIPKVDGIDTFTNVITYRRVDFTRKVIDLEMTDEYDDILIDCGSSEPKFDLSLLTKTIYVTDMFKYNLKKISHIKYYIPIQVKRELLIRDASDIKISAVQMASLTNMKFKEEEISVIYRDEGDYDNALICHYNQMFRLTRISNFMKTYLFQKITEFVSPITDKQIKSAYKKAKKGE